VLSLFEGLNKTFSNVEINGRVVVELIIIELAKISGKLFKLPL